MELLKPLRSAPTPSLKAVVGFRRSHALFFTVVLFLLAEAPSPSQQVAESVQIQVFADQPDGALPPIWNYFGYDEPNYTYAPNGQNLLR